MKELAHVLRLLARAATRRRRTAVFIGAAFVLLAVESSVVLAGGSPLHHAKASARAANPIATAASHASAGSKVIVGHSVKNDTSPALRSMPPIPLTPSREHQEVRNPFIPNGKSSFRPDRAVQTRHFPNSMPNPILNFDPSRASHATARLPTRTARSASPSTSRSSTRATRSSTRTPATPSSGLSRS